VDTVAPIAIGQRMDREEVVQILDELARVLHLQV